MECETLIVSDVHLGSAVSLAAALTHLLKNSTFKRLILLGDIFQDLDFSRLTSEQSCSSGPRYSPTDPTNF